MASEKSLEDLRITRKGDPNPIVSPSTLKMSFKVGLPLHPVNHALQISKDASREGWGAHLGEHTTRKTWSLPDNRFHINYLELTAFFLALKGFQALCLDMIVLNAKGNSCCLHMVVGLRSGPLCSLLWRILTEHSRKEVNLKA